MKISDDLSDERLQAEEKRLRRCPILKVAGVERDKFTHKSPRMGLKYIINQLHTNLTLNAKSEKVQCYPNKRRSSGDIFRIMRYYYPNITFKETRSLLYEMIEKKELSTLFCGNIGKRVFFKLNHIYGGNRYTEGLFDTMDEDEFSSKLHTTT